MSVLPGIDLTSVELAVAAVVVFAAAIVRGYSGFGFSMLTVTGLSLLRPPAEVVPMVLLLEIAASAHLLPAVWRDVHWQSLRWLLIGTVVATPLGVAILAGAPADAMRLLVSVGVLGAAAALWRGFALQHTPGAAATFGTGVVSGLLNGSAGIAGPPAILFYFSSPAGAAVSRASLIAYFLGTDVLAVGTSAAFGLIRSAVVWRCIALLAPLVLGVAIGHRRFTRADPAGFRRFVLVVLMLLAVAGVVRSVW